MAPPTLSIFFCLGITLLHIYRAVGECIGAHALSTTQLALSSVSSQKETQSCRLLASLTAFDGERRQRSFSRQAKK